MSNPYIFTSKRLGFRKWNTSDIKTMHEISSDQEVMQYFPATQTKAQTTQFIQRMQQQFDENGYCYFAVEIIKTKEFIGFIGICKQTYEADFNPATDIGWRLHKRYWSKGYATEGARACLHFAFTVIGLKEIVAVAPKYNVPSISVMKKIGMTKVKEFEHPLLKEYPDLKDCVLYAIKA